MTPALQEAYHRLYEAWWNEAATLESDLRGYSLISHDDTNLLDDAAGAIEELLAEQKRCAS